MNFGIPWNEIKARWESGESAYFIEQDLNRKGQKITRQGINARAKRDGWEVKANGGLMAVAAELPTIEADHGRNLSLRSPERIAGILQALKDGSPHYLAAEANGVPRGTWDGWRRADVELARAADEARLGNLREQVQVIHKAGQRGDWKASQVLLKAAPETKDYFAEDTKPTAIQFVLNITRGEIAQTGVTLEQQAIHISNESDAA